MEIERERECKNTLKMTFKSMYERIKKLNFFFFSIQRYWILKVFLKYKNFDARENLFQAKYLIFRVYDKETSIQEFYRWKPSKRKAMFCKETK